MTAPSIAYTFSPNISNNTYSISSSWLSTTTAATTNITLAPSGQGISWAPTGNVTYVPWIAYDYGHASVLVDGRLAPPLEFNKYINASDLLEEFIKWLGVEGIRQGEILQLPIDLFIKWLVIRACEEDKEEPNVVLQLPAPRQQPRCLGCGQWMRKMETIHLHSEKCSHFYFERQTHANQ